MAELLEKRTRSSKTHSLGGRKFAWDGTIGSIHYQDNGWQEIDNEFLPVAPPWNWEMVRAGYHVRVKEDFTAGQVLGFWKDGFALYFQPMALEYTNDLGQIQPIGMPQNVTPLITNPIVDLLPKVGVPSHQGTIRWNNAYGSGIDFEWKCQSTRLAKTLSINSLSNLPVPQQYILDGGNPVLRLNLIFDPPSKQDVGIVVDGQVWNQQNDTQTFETIEFVKDDEVLWGFMPLKYWDSADNRGQSVATLEKRGNKLYISIRVPYDWLQTATFPVFIDTDVDETVDARKEEATERANGTGFSTSYTIKMNSNTLADYVDNGGFYWDTVDVPQGNDNIIAANVSLYIQGGNDNPYVDIYGNDVDSANNFNIEADVTSRTRTGASQVWEATGIGGGYRDSPDITDPIQEIVARGGWSALNNICVLICGRLGTDRAFSAESYYFADPGEAAKLHIEYGEGAPEEQVLTAAVVAVSSSVVTSVVSGDGDTSLTQAVVAVSSSVQNAVLAGTGIAPLTQAVVAVSSSVINASIGYAQQYLVQSPVAVSSSIQTAAVAGTGIAPLTGTVVGVSSSVITATIRTSVQFLVQAVVAVSSSVVNAVLSGTGIAPLTATVVSVSSSVSTASIAGSGVVGLSGAVVAVTASVQNAALSGSGTAPLTAAVVAVTSSVVNASIQTSAQILVQAVIAASSSVVNAGIAGIGVAPLAAAVVAVASSVQAATIATVGVGVWVGEFCGVAVDEFDGVTPDEIDGV